MAEFNSEITSQIKAEYLQRPEGEESLFIT